MKKIFARLFILGLILGIAATAQAQPPYASVDIGDEISYPGTVLVPVDVDFNLGKVVRSYEFRINFDTSVLQFVDLVNIDPAFGVVNSYDNTLDADLVITWEAPLGTLDIAQAFVGKMFDIEFNLLDVAYSDIEFYLPNVVGETEIGGGDAGDGQADRLDSEFINGSVTGIAPPIPLKNWSLILGLVLISGFLATRLIRIL